MSVVPHNYFRFQPLLLDDGSDDDARSSSDSLFSAPSDIDRIFNTSYTTDSHRSDSPTPSIISITPSLEARAFKVEYGRGMNSASDVYCLPADDEELDRLDRQHLLFIEVMGKYPRVVRLYLTAAFPGDLKNILDLGCGSGLSIMQAARDFPNCDAIAVDLVPMQSFSMPFNCRSEGDGINLGLQHVYDVIDFAHARLISSGIKIFPALIHEIARSLKPGGYVEAMEFDFHAYDRHLQQIVKLWYKRRTRNR
nr:LaeA2 protein [Pleurotus ostreatus]